MYSLDINFLNDRNLTSDSASMAGKSAAKKSSVPAGQEPLPLILGGAIAAIAFAGVGFTYWQATQAKAATQEEMTNVDGQIQQLNAQSAKAAQLQQEVDLLKGQSQAFVEVLQTKIKPWSAILGEISDLTPPSLRIESLSLAQPETAPTSTPSAAPAAPTDPAAAPAPAPAPTDPAAAAPPTAPITNNTVLIKGLSRNFNDVNDFVINLQASPLFASDDIYIVKAALIDNPTTLEFSRPVESYTLPKVVEYTISLTLKDLTDTEIIKTLEAQGARGMAERLKNSF